MTNVEGQMGPHLSLTEGQCFNALKAILEKQGARNLVGELHRLMQKRKVDDVADLFDCQTAGMLLGPAAVVRDMKSAAEWGTADNYTYHFAMTAIVYAMALEKFDPDFFKESKHAMPQDRDGYQQRRHEIMAYVRALSARE